MRLTVLRRGAPALVAGALMLALLPAWANAAPPLAAGSPWPKFRANLAQDGRSQVTPRLSGRPWSFKTAKGIFSSPVIGRDGTVYVGSADRVFYALTKDGRVRWKLRTGEIIDSAALLDDRGRVYVPSADGHVYARDATTGGPVWTFEPDSAASTGAFINWFEGNVSMGADGTLYVPNDNFRTYALDRDTGRPRWAFKTLDQTWSSPAYDAANRRVVFGSNFFLFGTPSTFSIDAGTGEQRWAAQTQGATVASPLVADGRVYAGSFDGYLRAYDSASGRLLWRFGTRDHLYASPARQPDGTVVQPSADGAVYGVSGTSGRLRWEYDTLAPIRSSPAVDAMGRVYVGTGDGRLLVLNADGTLRWSIKLARPPRGTLNSSPALGRDAIVIADSNGDVHSVPYDWCLSSAGRHDSRCETATAAVAASRAALDQVTAFGLVRTRAADSIGASQPLALQLDVRHAGHARAAFIDPSAVHVTTTPRAKVRVRVSGDRRDLVIIPATEFRAARDGRVRIDVAARYLTGARRNGLAFSGGHSAGTVRRTLRPRLRFGSAGRTLPLPVPRKPGQASGAWQMSRLALSLPDLLPSYNQIGFDRLDFVLSLVAPAGRGGAIGWMIGATAGASGPTPDPFTKWAVPFVVRYDHGQISFTNAGGATFELNGFTNVSGFWRMAARLNPAGSALGPMDVTLDVDCAKIGFYGQALQGLGACTKDRPMSVFGASLLHPVAPQRPPRGAGRVSYAIEDGRVVARIADSTIRADHSPVTVLAVDAATGVPLALDYSYGTVTTKNADGTVGAVSLALPAHAPKRLRLFLMVGATSYGPWTTLSTR